VLGLRQTLGAGLPIDANDADPAPPLVAVISHLLWERHFERAPDVIGREMKVNGVTVTIVGVAPRRFAGARTGGSQMRVWLPLSTRPQLQRTAATLTSYDDARYGLAARLHPGMRADQTGPTVQAIATRAEQQATMSRATLASTDVVPLLAGNYFPPSGAEEPPSAGPVLSLIFPVLVLLITCTNVSALLAGLGVARRREIAVRLALGAGRRRVVRQLVTETVVLAMAAGALGLFVIWLLLRLFDASIPDLAIEIDWRSIAFTFGLALAAGLAFGLSPALHATRLALQEALKDSAGIVVSRRLRLQSWLVVAQIAFTQPALLSMGALLLEMRSDLRQLRAQPYADASSSCASTSTRATAHSMRNASGRSSACRSDSRPCPASPVSCGKNTAILLTWMSILPTSWPGWSWHPRSRWTRLQRRPATSRSWASRSYEAAISTRPSAVLSAVSALESTTAPSSSAAAWHDGCGAVPMQSAGGSSRWVPLPAASGRSPSSASWTMRRPASKTGRGVSPLSRASVTSCASTSRACT